MKKWWRNLHWENRQAIEQIFAWAFIIFITATALKLLYIAWIK